MKLEIKKFKKHNDLIIDFPASITGGNGTGKTTIYEAFLWCLNEKNVYGNEFPSSNVYSNTDVNGERWAEVAFYSPSGIFRKKAKPLYSRERGSDVEVLKTELNCEYFFNESPVKKSEYDVEITKMCKLFDLSLFSNPMYFYNLPQKEKLKIISQIVNLKLIDYISLLPNRAVLVEEIRKQKNEIYDLDTKIKSLKETFFAPDNERNTERVNEIRAEIERLQKEEKEAVSQEVLINNEKIREKIREIQNQQFIPQQRHAFTPETKKSLYELKNYVENPKIAEMRVKWNSYEETKKHLIQQIDKEKSKKGTISNICTQSISIEDYICKVCPNCKNECENIQRNTSKNDSIIENAQRVEVIDSEILRLETKLAEIEKLINEIIEEGKKLKKEDAQKNAEIDKENAELKLQNELITEANETINERNEAEQNRINEINAKIQKENAANAILFEDKKTKDIAALRSKIVTEFQKIDNSLKINTLFAEKYDLQKEDETKEKQKYAYDTAQEQIAENTDKINSVRYKLVQNEKSLIEIESAEHQYRVDCQDKISEFLPDGVEIQLFKKLITSDGFEECAILKIDGYENPNTSRANSKLAILCECFQKHFAVELPIFYDNAENCEPINMPKIQNIIELRVKENEKLTIKNL